MTRTSWSTASLAEEVVGRRQAPAETGETLHEEPVLGAGDGEPGGPDDGGDLGLTQPRLGDDLGQGERPAAPEGEHGGETGEPVAEVEQVLGVGAPGHEELEERELMGPPPGSAGS